MSNQEIFSQQGAGLVPIAFYPTNRQPEFGNYTDLSPSVKVGSSGSSGNPPAVAFERRMVRTTGGQPQEELSHCLRADAGTGDGAPCVAYGVDIQNCATTGDISGTLLGEALCKGGQAGLAVAVDSDQCAGAVACYDYLGTQGGGIEIGISPTLKKKDGVATVTNTMQVRRLTPRECERLQGFPDDHTLIPWRGKTAPDGPRYKALGNSMAVPVMRWIGQRIAHLESTNTTPTTP